MKKEKEETPVDEAEESPEVQEKEKKEGTEKHPVPLSEQFQRDVLALVYKATTKEQLSFIRECVYKKEDEMRKKESKGKNKVPTEYSVSDMPND